MASSDQSVSSALLHFQRAFLARYAYLPEAQQRAKWIEYLSDAQKKARTAKFNSSTVVPQKRYATDHGLDNGSGSKRPTQAMAGSSLPQQPATTSLTTPTVPEPAQSMIYSLPISIPGHQQLNDRRPAPQPTTVMAQRPDLLDVQFIDQPQHIPSYNSVTGRYMPVDPANAVTVGNYLNQDRLVPAAIRSQAVGADIHNTIPYGGERMIRSATNDVCESLNTVQVTSPTPTSTSNNSSPDPIFPFVESDSSSAEDQKISYVSPYSPTRVVGSEQAASRGDPAVAATHERAPSQVENQIPTPPTASSQRSRMTKRTSEQNALSARPIAPKDYHNAQNSPTSPTCEPILRPIPNADGTTTMKAAITPLQPRPMKSRTTFCAFCSEHPHGFHGDHELRRHIDRHHTQVRRVWVCRDPTEGQTFLRNCNACRTGKTYGANYNCAAHLRRTHFNPCKNKRGGRKKKSEGRGGMGGGSWPSMEELKDWMYETYEDNSSGRVIVQQYPQDPSTMPIHAHGIVPPIEPQPCFEVDLDNFVFDINSEVGGFLGADGIFYPHSDIGQWSACSEMFSAPNTNWLPSSMPLTGGLSDMTAIHNGYAWPI